MNFARFLIPIGFVLSLTPWFDSAMALGLGITIALVFGNPYIEITRKWTKRLLAWSIVALGAGVDLHVIAKAGSDGLIFTVIGLALALIVGYLVGKLLKIESMMSLLVNVGTAICGGSAIASVSSALGAKDRDVSVSLAIVFVLNALALVIFPALGHHFDLTQHQFGLWAALAIHDTSSVVGASMKYGAEALEVGTTVKLVRALWIIPVTILMIRLYKDGSNESSGPRQYPWFIAGFLIMSALTTWVPVLKAPGAVLATLGKHTLTATLFLIGTGLTMEALRKVGMRPLAHGVILWIIVGTGNLLAILYLYS